MRTRYIPFSIRKRNNTLIYPKSAAMGFFEGTEEQVRNSRGKQAISVRAIEVPLYTLIAKVNRKVSYCL